MTMASSWPTPDAAISNDHEEPETFRARQEKQKAKGINGNGMGMPLAMAAKTWPSTNNWPTPAARDWRSDSSQLSDEELYGTKGRPLARTAEQWMTPRVSEDGQYQYSRGNKSNPVLTLQGQGQGQGQAMMPFRRFLPEAFFRRDLPISIAGEECSPTRRSLNPLFVEWLMGWPPGWTSLALTPIASNGCACSAMALSRYKQRMRSELSSLGSPPAAPPAQIDLFA